MVKKIIFTGGKTKGSAYSEAEVAQDYAIQHGVNPTDILIEKSSTITNENLKFAQPLYDSIQAKSALIVSDPMT